MRRVPIQAVKNAQGMACIGVRLIAQLGDTPLLANSVVRSEHIAQHLQAAFSMLVAAFKLPSCIGFVRL